MPCSRGNGSNFAATAFTAILKDPNASKSVAQNMEKNNDRQYYNIAYVSSENHPHEVTRFLADHTNGRAYAYSVVSVRPSVCRL